MSSESFEEHRTGTGLSEQSVHREKVRYTNPVYSVEVGSIRTESPGNGRGGAPGHSA